MIEISKTALMVLCEGLQASRIEPERGLRLKEQNNELVLETDIPKTGDRVISHNGQRVLILDPVTENHIGNAVIEVEETAEGPEIVLRTC